MQKRPIGSPGNKPNGSPNKPNGSPGKPKPRQTQRFAYASRTQRVVNRLQPLQLGADSNHLQLSELLVFAEGNATVLSLVGASGTLNVRLSAKGVAGLARMLVNQLVEPARPETMRRVGVRL